MFSAPRRGPATVIVKASAFAGRTTPRKVTRYQLSLHYEWGWQASPRAGEREQSLREEPVRSLMKTLAIRLDDDLHARLSVLAKLAEVPVSDVIRRAIETELTAMSSDPALSDKASDLQADIERDAAAQRAAIAEIFGSAKASKSRATPTGSSSATNKR
ncbi:MAG: ribbon-helix-helix protein, CopG family [Nocardioides sp.]